MPQDMCYKHDRNRLQVLVFQLATSEPSTQRRVVERLMLIIELVMLTFPFAEIPFSFFLLHIITGGAQN